MKRLTVALMLLVPATPALAQADLTKLRVAYDGFSMTSGPLTYADKQGIFKEFGLDTTPVFVAGGSALTQAVVGGSLDIAQNGYTPALSAAVQGADIVIIGGISNKLPFQLVVKDQITNADQLRGQSIAISRFGSSTDAAAELALERLKLGKDDVRIIQLGGESNRLAAALSGQIGGTMEQQPDTAELTQHGFHILLDLTDLAGEYPNTSYVTSRTFLKAHPDIVKRFMMAMATAVHAYKTHPQIAIPLTQQFLGVKDAAATRIAYESYLKIYPDDLHPSLQGIALVLKSLAAKDPKVAAMKPEQFVDTSTLEALKLEGFFEKTLATR
jgi:NitT/TauT family transport system substrate-binding protein